MRYLLSAVLCWVGLGGSPSVMAISDIDKLRIIAALEIISPDLSIDSVVPSEVPGLFMVTAGSEVFYVTEDANHMFYGTLLDLNKNKQNWNLTEKVRRQIRLKTLSELDTKDMITYSPKGEVKGVVTIFTDIDCGYCRKLHQEMSEINDLGIEVRYLAFPRAGVDSKSFDTTVSVWCADNPSEMMTTAKRGGRVPSATCQNPVNEHFEIGRSMGVRGTPTLVFEDGTLLSSYLPAQRLQTLAQQLSTRVKTEKAEAARVKAEKASKAEVERIKAEKEVAARVKAEAAEMARMNAVKAENEKLKAEVKKLKAGVERIKAEKIKLEQAKAEEMGDHENTSSR